MLPDVPSAVELGSLESLDRRHAGRAALCWLGFAPVAPPVKLRMMSQLRYRAGPRALGHLRRFGLRGQVRVFVAPATGPKWLAAYGFDRALIDGNLFDGSVPTLLAGASAGAWRSLSFASPEPAAMHRALMEAYCVQEFSRADTPATVRSAFEEMLAKLFAGSEQRILAHPSLRLAIHTARARGSGGRASTRWHLASLSLAALLNPWSPRAQQAALERVTFHSREVGAALVEHRGRRVELLPTNLLPAALASATVPLAMEPIGDIPGAPDGIFLDGGMTDYHVAERYVHARPGVTLLFTHQRRLFGRWLDQYLPWRNPRGGVLEDLVHVYPAPDFVASLPGGSVPTRHDYRELVDLPGERVRRWKTAVLESERLGECFLRDLESGRLIDSVEPFS